MLGGGESVQLSRYTGYFDGFVYVLKRCLYLHVFSYVFEAWERSREAFGDVWGIIEGNLGTFRASWTSQEKE